MSQSLVSQLFNPNRRALLRALGSTAPSSYTIVVEGLTDARFFQENLQSATYGYATFLPAIRVDGIPGKDSVIEIVRHYGEEYLGVVDMDHDFDSDEVSFSDRIGDTSDQCCLLSWVMSKQCKGIPEFSCEFVDYYLKDARSVTAQNMIRTRSAELVSFVMELTRARLFRGRVGIAIGKSDIGVDWTGMDDLRLSVSHLVPEEHVGRFEEFKAEWKEQLGQIGPNDHDLSTAMALLLKEMGEEVDSEDISSKMGKFLAFRMGTEAQRRTAGSDLIDKSITREAD